MTSVIPDSGDGKRDIRCDCARVRGCEGAARANGKQRSQRHACGSRARLDHRRRCLARRDHVDSGRPVDRLSCVAGFERTAHERSGIHGIDGRTQDCDEIVAEV